MSFTSSSALSLWPFCNSAMARSCRTWLQRFNAARCGQQNGRRIFLVIFRAEIASKAAGLPAAILQWSNHICSRPATHRRRMIAVATQPETRWSLPPVPGNNFARLSSRSRLISASCRCHWWAHSLLCDNGHFQPVNDVCSSRSDLMPIFIQNIVVTTGDNRCQCKILVIRHRRWNDAGHIKSFAFGLPLVFELLPRMPASPVLLGVKQRQSIRPGMPGQKEAFGLCQVLFGFSFIYFCSGGASSMNSNFVVKVRGSPLR